jgi:3-hydroxyisobutyrate dehydrogenase
MVARLSARGLGVLAYDLDPAKAQAAAALPGVSAASSLDGVRSAALVVCMLPDSAAVEQVTAGRGGLFEVLAPGALIVDMGSSDPRRTVELAASARAAGLALLDAPVSGGAARARTGELTVMFGGTEEQLAYCRPVLDAVATTVVPVGTVGAGHAMKALNNVMSAVGLSIACEVVEVGRRYGLEPAVMLEVLNQSTGRNHATETKIEQYVLSETFDSGFLLRLMLKDLVTAVALARELGARIPIAEACLGLWQEAAERLPADADQTRIALLLAGALVPEPDRVRSRQASRGEEG